MDRITPRTNAAFDRTIRDWIIQFLSDQALNPPYRDALIEVLHLLWHRQEDSLGAAAKPSYFPLPTLCGQALGRYSDATTAVNAAWVLLYMASYVFDKVEDHETGHPILSRFGYGAAVNLASGLILQSERILAELEPAQTRDRSGMGDGGINAGGINAGGIDAGGIIDEAVLAHIRRRFNQIALEVCAGQHLDLTLQEPSFNEVWEIVDAKSGKFFAMGAYLGARLATDDPARQETFAKVGRHLGILIQIKNDLYGLGTAGSTGSDLTAGKRTLPVLYALHVLPAAERARLVDDLRAAPEAPSAEEEARRAIFSAGVNVYLSLEAEKHKQQALHALTSLGLDPELTRPFIDLLNYAHPSMLPGH